MRSLRPHFLALILAALGALAWWLQRGMEREEEAPQLARERQPDYTVDNFTATTMDATGTPHRRLSAPELRHYADDDSSELERPVLTVFSQTAPPWIVRSDTGWVSADGDEVHMRGKVFIDRESSETARPVHLRTRDLLVRPGEEFAETLQPVQATSGADWLTSDTGGQVWFGDSLRIKLGGRARILYFVDGRDGSSQPMSREESR